MSKERNNHIFIIVILTVCIIWTWSWIYIDLFIPLKDRANFGDKFGFVNSLFSGLALAVIIFSIMLQQKELSLQRKELNDTRKEFADQNFQTTFFNLLQTQQQITNEIFGTIWDLKSYDKEYKKEFNGRKFFNYSKYELERILNSLSNNVFIKYNPFIEYDEYSRPSSDDEESELTRKQRIAYTNFYYAIDETLWIKGKDMTSQKKAKLAYAIFFNKFGYVVGHYFRHFYHILKFLRNLEIQQLSKAKSNEKKTKIELKFRQYADFVQAQMTIPEMFLLHYNCLSFPKLKALVLHYQLLENFNEEDLIKPEHKIEEVNLKKRGNLLN